MSVKVVIQCAASKDPQAGHLTDGDGRPVLFVANPQKAPPSATHRYARPDEPAGHGKNWRDVLIDYNDQAQSNPLHLRPAYKLYSNPTYVLLVQRYGAENVFILSAGWGLINAEYLTPLYDITFSASAAPYKRRRKRDHYNDLCLLPTGSGDDLVFFGGKDYLPLFCDLTRDYNGRRFVFYNLAAEPLAPGCTLMRYPTTTRTNWHYSCASAFMAGELRLSEPGA